MEKRWKIRKKNERKKWESEDPMAFGTGRRAVVCREETDILSLKKRIYIRVFFI